MTTYFDQLISIASMLEFVEDVKVYKYNNSIQRGATFKVSAFGWKPRWETEKMLCVAEINVQTAEQLITTLNLITKLHYGKI